MKRTIGIFVLLSIASSGYALGRVDLGIGGAFYSDAIGFTVNAGYSRSLAGWGALFGGSTENASFFLQRFIAGAGLTANLVPISFSIYTINFELKSAFQVKLSDFSGSELPLSFYPYVNLGTPLNLFSYQGNSAANGGFMLSAGLKSGYLIGGKIEAGLGCEYQMNLTGMYIGSLGAYVYGAYDF